MFLRAKIQCPACQRFHCRESRWHSPDEKMAHIGCRPYRCLDCSHRFLVPESETANGVMRVSLPLAVLAIVVAFAAILFMTQTEPTPRTGGSATNALYDPEIRKAAERGDPVAQFQLGEALFHDPSRSKENSEEAIRWLQASAEGGNTEAMIFLGRLSRTGVGILQNFAHASEWIRTAAVSGSPEGMLELGRLYRDGVGVEKDLVKAYVWFNRAAAARNLDAVREREAIARVLTPDELREAQKQSSAPRDDKPRK